MKLKNAVLNIKQTCGDQFILTEVSPVYRYVDGKRTGDPLGFNYSLILPQRKFDTLRVKIDGDCQLEVGDEPISVKLDDLKLEIKWSQSEGNYIAGTASRIYPVN